MDGLADQAPLAWKVLPKMHHLWTIRFLFVVRMFACRSARPLYSPHCLGQSSQTNRRGHCENQCFSTAVFSLFQALFSHVFSHQLLPAVDRFTCESLRHPKVRFLFGHVCQNSQPISVLSLASGQATIDPTAYRENRIRQLKEAGSNFTSVHVWVVNVVFL